MTKKRGITFVQRLVLHSLVLIDKLCTRKLRCPRNLLHLHLFVSFIMRAFMTLLKDIIFFSGLSMNIIEKNGLSYFYDQVRQQTVSNSARHNLNTVIIPHTVKPFQSFRILSLFNDRTSVSILAGTMCQSSGIAVQRNLINERSINHRTKNILLRAQTYFLTYPHTFGTYTSCLMKRESNKHTEVKGRIKGHI